MWSESEFGHADLDVRNCARLVRIASGVAASSASTIAHTFLSVAETHAAYDFIEHKKISGEALIAASRKAAARRARTERRVLVPLDGSSVALRDPHRTRGSGPVGTRANGGRGLKMIAGGVLTEQGVPLGLGGLVCWTRSEKAPGHHARRPVARRETQFQLNIRAQLRETFRLEAPETEYVMIEDRGGDAWAVLLDVFKNRPENERSIIRAAQDRRAELGHQAEDGIPKTRLRSVLRRAPLLGTFGLKLSATAKRAERVAQIQVRAAPITVDLLTVPGAQHFKVQINAVWAHEVGNVPRGQERADWILLTDLPASSFTDARYVIDAYAKRWRIEEFFKVLKGGVIDIESVRLHSMGAIRKWLALQCANAMRILRLVQLSRTEPDRDASKEFDPDELEATRDLYAAQGRSLARKPKLIDVVLALASIAGSHRARGELPGAIVLERAMERVQIVAAAARGKRERAARSKRKPNARIRQEN